MKYFEPEIKINSFSDNIEAGAESPAANAALASANYNKATRSLEEMFVSAASDAERILVFNW